jgi:5-(carboxyamino)imidazole ribonucleotide synthase
MENLIGEAALDWERFAADPNAHLHLYGKRDARAGRKMGHVTRLKLQRGNASSRAVNSQKPST